jgi:glycosyltransferase involved in cell wall biosynthesis
MSELGWPPRPHHVSPALASARVVLAVKNFAAIPGVCHIGLGVTALNTMKVLRRYGLHVETWAAQSYKELRGLLSKHRHDARPITHVIVSSPAWIQPDNFQTLCELYPETEFVELNHSGTAYLSIDKYGIRNIRANIALEETTHNMRVAFNNPRGNDWASAAFGYSGLLLPNLYDTQTFVKPLPIRNPHPNPIRIGSFGASRPWKNQLTAAEAAVQLARRLGVQLELYVNSKRPDGGERMIESRLELFNNLPGCKLIDVPWAPWPQFRDIVAQMNILFSPSFDETFCVVAADGIAEGVPSVVTGALEWTPKNWWCEPYNPSNLVQVAMGLLHDSNGTIEDARILLNKFVTTGVRQWLDYVEKTA